MGKYVIAGNWKMNKTPAEAKALIEEIRPLVADAACDVVVGVPFVDLPVALEATKGTNIGVAAQNVEAKVLHISTIKKVAAPSEGNRLVT